MQKSQTKRGGLPFVRSEIFIDWTVKNAVFRCNRYVALPAIIPHGRGEGERLIHGGGGDVGYSVSHVAPWVKHKTITGTTSGAGNIPFEGLENDKCVILSAIAVSGDNVVIPYTGYPSRGILGAHVIKDSQTYTAVINSKVTINVYYFEL